MQEKQGPIMCLLQLEIPECSAVVVEAALHQR